MTELLTRPPAAPPTVRARPTPVVAAVSAAWAAGLGLALATVVVLLAWSTDSASTAGASVALHAAGHAWLLAGNVPLDVPGGRLGLVPLGAALVPVLLLWRAGAATARAAGVTDLPGAARASIVLAAAYGVLAALVAVVAATPAVQVPPARALAGAGALALLAGGGGVLRQSGLVDRLARRLPAALPGMLLAAAAGLLALAAVGALLVGVSLGWHVGRAGELARALAPGASGGVGLWAMDLALLPNAVVWAAAFAVGPGFALGAGTSVTPFGVSLGPVPAFPLLAALPAGGAAPLAALPGLLGPLAAGVVVGLVAVRRCPAAERGSAAGRAATAGLGAGLLLGLAAALAGGPLGPGRLAVVGPSPWRVALVAVLELAPLAAVTAWWWSGRVSG